MIVWTEYMSYRANIRGFDRAKIEDIVKYSNERYLDTATGRYVIVGRHEQTLVMIPFEGDAGSITPITIHATTRKQINFRIKSGRLTYE